MSQLFFELGINMRIRDAMRGSEHAEAQALRAKQKAAAPECCLEMAGWWTEQSKLAYAAAEKAYDAALQLEASKKAYDAAALRLEAATQIDPDISGITALMQKCDDETEDAMNIALYLYMES